ncbi:hypothetical protein BGZ58_006698 [Dissophora ornata]|nr:hypothetical protein BGZ58_006698 [Dissophora ornata]
MFIKGQVNEAISEIKRPDMASGQLFSEAINFNVYRRSDSNMIGWKAFKNTRLHYVAEFPWPFSSCDYVYELCVQEFGGGVVGVNGKSHPDGSITEKPDVVRVDDF